MPRINRLFINEKLSPNCTVSLTLEQAHYLKNVLRLDENAPLFLVNDADGEWNGILKTLSKKSGEVLITDINRSPYPISDIWICFTPLKKDSFDFAIEKSVELVANTICPIITEFTDHNKINLTRTNTAIIESIQQCGSLHRPVCLEPVSLIKLLKNWDKERALYVAFESGQAIDFAETLLEQNKSKSTPKKAAIMVGPEGGFSNEEQELIRSFPFIKPVSLGPEILRAETAVTVALALWQSLAGHWNQHKR